MDEIASESSAVQEDQPTAVRVRVETSEDYASVGEVVRHAFGQEEIVELVDRIRQSENFVPELSLVAEANGKVVGHVLLSHVNLNDKGTSHSILTLSPVSVSPEVQGQGIGGALIKAAINKADQLGEPLIVLEGDSRYYPRFGFQPSKRFGITIHLPDWAPEEAGMVHPLSSYDPQVKGEVVYPPAFDLVNQDRA